MTVQTSHVHAFLSRLGPTVNTWLNGHNRIMHVCVWCVIVCVSCTARVSLRVCHCVCLYVSLCALISYSCRYICVCVCVEYSLLLSTCFYGAHSFLLAYPSLLSVYGQASKFMMQKLPANDCICFVHYPTCMCKGQSNRFCPSVCLCICLSAQKSPDLEI